MLKKLFFLLIMGLSLHAGATPLSAAETRSWKSRISAACQKNFKAKSDKAATCDCVTRHFLRIAERETTVRSTQGLLKYVENFYAAKLTSTEIRKDPFFLTEYILAIGNGCVQDPLKFHLRDLN